MGLHTVFEHHAVMRADALRVFVREYRLAFPIDIDQRSEHGVIPLTMQAFGLRGTPSLVLLDRQGRLRLNHFGQLDDLRVGALLGQLVVERTEQAAGDAGDLESHVHRHARDRRHANPSEP